MPKTGDTQHEQVLEIYLKELEQMGYKTINLKGKSPDGLAIKDNKIIAIEVLSSYYNKKHRGWNTKRTKKQKKELYSMFDDVFIRTFKKRQNND